MKSGFCCIGLCEGTRPIDRKGKPMKVCVAFDWCPCSCHRSISKMYELTGSVRVGQQNPDYEPAPNPDLSFIYEMQAGASIVGGGITRTPVEQPSPVATGLRESTRTFAPTATGGRARGQLEVEVQQVCNRYMVGELEGLLTTKFIGHLINPDDPPSQGAIGAVLERWAKIGYATVGTKPLRFSGYTVEGMKKGLEQMKNEQKRRH